MLAHIQPAVNRHPQALFCQAAFQPPFPEPVTLCGVTAQHINLWQLQKSVGSLAFISSSFQQSQLCQAIFAVTPPSPLLTARMVASSCSFCPVFGCLPDTSSFSYSSFAMFLTWRLFPQSCMAGTGLWEEPLSSSSYKLPYPEQLQRELLSQPNFHTHICID